jgi:hypothetical protein
VAPLSLVPPPVPVAPLSLLHRAVEEPLTPRRTAAAAPSLAPSSPPTPPPEESAPAPIPPEQERGPFPPTPLKLAGGLAEVWEADGYVKVRFPGGPPEPGTRECRIKNELKDQDWTFFGKEKAWTRKTGKAPDRARQEARLALAHELGDDGRVPGSGAAVPTYSAPEPQAAGRRGRLGARSEPEPEPVVVEGTIHARLVGRDVAFSPASYLGPEVFEVYKCACYGGIFHKRTNTYRAHPTNAQQAIANLTTAGFTVDVAPGVRARIEETARERARAVEQATARATALDAMLKLEGGEVFPHQFEGIRWLADRLDRGALLADDMGLGKTIQTLVAIPENARVLVICPAIVKSVWADEADRWRRDYGVSILKASDGLRWPERGEIVIVNYDVLPKCSTELKDELVEALHGDRAATGDMKKLAERAAGVVSLAEAERLARMKTMELDETRRARAALAALHEALAARSPGDTTGPLRNALVAELRGATSDMLYLALRLDQMDDIDVDTYDSIAGEPALSHPLAGPARAVLKQLREALEFEASVPSNMLILADEAHRLGNPKSQRTRRVRALGDATRAAGGSLVAITATPMRNRPPELRTVLQAAGIDREAFCDWDEFVRLFGAKKGSRGGISDWGNGKTISPEVPERLRRVELRRTKKMLNLPPLTYRTVFAPIDDETARKADEALAALEAKGVSIEEAVDELAKNNLSFRELSTARAAMAQAKIPTLLRVVEEYERQGEPVVAFSAFLGPLTVLGQRRGWATLTGGTADADRRKAQARFQRGELRGLAATIQAGGVGITLTRAANLILSDRAWTPADNDQARDRVHRIGQKRPVTITLIIADHELDRKIAGVLDKKAGIIAASVDASAVEHVALPEAPAPLDWDAMERDALKALAEARAERARGQTERARRRVAGVRAYVAKAAARRLDEAQASEILRHPQTPEERWAAQGLVSVAGDDPDRAREKNDVGFSQADGGLGHALAFLLADEPALTDQQWRLAVRLAHKYRRQIGMPAPEPMLAVGAA